jgi:hypothetical protein
MCPLGNITKHTRELQKLALGALSSAPLLQAKMAFRAT